jgi:hypothetical protein
VVGKFEGNVVIFEGHDTFNGIPILVRYIWTLNPKSSQVVAKWEQAFSTDDGKTWETNWHNEFIHDDNCTSPDSDVERDVRKMKNSVSSTPGFSLRQDARHAKWTRNTNS